MTTYNPVSDVKGFLASKGNIRTGAHNFSRKVLHWPFCQNCGLMWLKNEPTRKAAKAPCQWEDD